MQSSGFAVAMRESFSEGFSKCAFSVGPHYDSDDGYTARITDIQSTRAMLHGTVLYGSTAVILCCNILNDTALYDARYCRL